MGGPPSVDTNANAEDDDNSTGAAGDGDDGGDDVDDDDAADDNDDIIGADVLLSYGWLVLFASRRRLEGKRMFLEGKRMFLARSLARDHIVVFSSCGRGRGGWL